MTDQISERREQLLARLPKWEELIRGLAYRCRCRRGNRHGPYYCLSVTRQVGKGQLFYVPAESVAVSRKETLPDN